MFFSLIQTLTHLPANRLSSPVSSLTGTGLLCCFCQQEFFQYYIESNGSGQSADEENKMDLLKKGTYGHSDVSTEN